MTSSLRLLSDRLIIVMALPVLLPVLLVLALIVRLSSPGPVILGRDVMNANGKTYRELRFRSVWLDAHARAFARKAEGGDPRLTPIGRLMMRTGLNKLPMIYNVLKGDIPLELSCLR